MTVSAIKKRTKLAKKSVNKTDMFKLADPNEIHYITLK